MAYAGELYALAAALCWAVAVMFFRKSGERVPPVALNLFKGVVTLVLLVPTLALTGTSLAPDDVTVSDWLRLVASGVVGITLADTLFFASLNRLGAGRSAIVDCLYSPLVIVCAAMVLAEPIGAALLLGLALMIGAILLEAWQPGREADAEARRRRRVGVLLGALSMLAMALGVVLAKPVLERADVLWAMTVRLLAGVALLALQGATAAHRADVARTLRPSRQWRVTVPAAIIGAYLAMMVWLAGLKYTLTSVASVLNQTSALFIPLLAAVVLGERLTRRKGIAVAMGFGGAVIATLWGRG